MSAREVIEVDLDWEIANMKTFIDFVSPWNPKHAEKLRGQLEEMERESAIADQSGGDHE